MNHLNNLDSIRTIAFLLTFYVHAFYSDSKEIINDASFKFLTDQTYIFSFGVPIFFVLSGFLITYLLLLEKTKTNTIRIGHFYMRRILRIWPLYFLILLIGFVFYPYFKTHILHEVLHENANPLYYLTFLSNVDQLKTHQLPIGVGLGPTWSISIEEQFYLVWPILVSLFAIRKSLFAFLFVIIISFIFCFHFNYSIKNSFFGFFYLGVGGMFGYLLVFYKERISRFSIKNTWFTLLVFGCCLFTMLISNQFTNKIIIHFFFAFGIGYLILHQALDIQFQLKKIPFFEKLGQLTFGMYLFHTVANFIVFSIFIKILKLNDSLMSTLLIRPLLSLFLTYLMASLSYKYVEKKILQFKNRFKAI